MPELPEVEFARRLVSRRLLNNELSEITLGVHANTSDRDELPRLESCQGHPLLGVLRHGKQLYLSFGVSGISFHLGMTGKLQVLAPSDVEPPHVRLKLHFQDRVLVFRDTRKIGQVRALSRGGWREYLTEKRVGPDFFAETGPRPNLTEGFTRATYHKGAAARSTLVCRDRRVMRAKVYLCTTAV